MVVAEYDIADVRPVFAARTTSSSRCVVIDPRRRAHRG